MDNSGWKGCILWTIFDKNFYLYGNTLICLSSRFFENQPNEICSHLSEKASKGMFHKPKKLIVTKEKEKRKRKSEEKERRRRKTSNGCTLSFYNSYFGDKKVHSAITISKIRLDI